MAQLEEMSYPIPEVCGSNSAITNFYWTYCIKKMQIKKKKPGMDLILGHNTILKYILLLTLDTYPRQLKAIFVPHSTHQLLISIQIELPLFYFTQKKHVQHMLTQVPKVCSSQQLWVINVPNDWSKPPETISKQDITMSKQDNKEGWKTSSWPKSLNNESCIPCSAA